MLIDKDRRKFLHIALKNKVVDWWTIPGCLKSWVETSGLELVGLSTWTFWTNKYSIIDRSPNDINRKNSKKLSPLR